jgi:hypothetical protein
VWDKLLRGRGEGKRDAPHALTYAALESTLCVALDLLSRQTEREGAHMVGVGQESVKELHTRFDAVLEEPEPILLKTELLATLEVLQEIRCVKVRAAGCLRLASSSGTWMMGLCHVVVYLMLTPALQVAALELQRHAAAAPGP